MEGRIRVSVVATGIDVEHQIQKVPERLHGARPAIKPLPARPEPPPRVEARPAPIANPVHRQVDALAEELGAARHVPPAPQPAPMPQPVAARAPMSETEHLILDEEADGRTLEEKYPVTVTIRPIPTRIQPVPEPSSRLFGFLGRKKKEEPRMEPVQMQRPQPQQARANAQVIARQPAPEPQRQHPQQQTQPQDDDLFPDHKRDEQFEIPAFLRRQTN
jgi:hypothetical protein